MKHLIPVILALLLCVSLLTGCNNGIKPSSQESAPATTAAAPATTAAAPVPTEPEPGPTEPEPGPTEPEPGPTEVPVDEPTGSVDMEAVLSKIVDENPGAGVEELQDALLENPYFLMFSADDVNCYWGFNSTYEYHDIREASCIVDHGYTNYGAVVYVIEPEVGVDAEALAAELEQNLNLSWTYSGDLPDKTLSMVRDGKILLSIYYSDMQPDVGPIAYAPADFIDLFHARLAEDPNYDCLALVQWFTSHSKIDCYLCSEAVVPGSLLGLRSEEDDAQILGFEDGAMFKSDGMPDTFLGYVFRVEDGMDPAEFKTQIIEHLNPEWNIFAEIDTTVIEQDGNYFLFMMFLA